MANESLVLEVLNVEKSFVPVSGSRVSVLKDINLRISTGECISITGRSGSGKSTLLSILAGLENADQGVVKILGKTWATLSEKERSRFRAQHLGFVFQSFYLLPHLTAAENIQLPLEIANQSGVAHATFPKLVQSWLETIGLWDRRDHLPKELSGGEQQRVAIARALIHQPSLVFLDEPTGNLDETTGENIFELLFSLKGKTSLVLVTHDMDQARVADRHYALHAGVLSTCDKTAQP